MACMHPTTPILQRPSWGVADGCCRSSEVAFAFVSDVIAAAAEVRRFVSVCSSDPRQQALMTLKGWVEGFITEVMQTFCELPTDASHAHCARFVVAPQHARRTLSNQTPAFDDCLRI